ncbi:peptide methionine sulfoxide reductase [Oleiphilus messinensis]|uniref:Peptide methionine sulfoxide reductase MsrA n=1 Tax=Oleiphilus messinensis TaxID=141451 RepID=A0A1Y0IA44_9GAMM|nr:peptide-methionine (S)-S-oxide reductase MsrA [Oleiphilus messinensis]ARU57029.1 peptide methionine sulfoxide reductase [Oleiphilus messinensis]
MGIFDLFAARKSTLPEPDQALPGRDTAMPIHGNHYVLQNALIPPFPERMETAVFGMGCFWGAEKLFWSQNGVFSTAVGYADGITPNPNYEEVCTGLTGHNEVVLVVFDPAIIGFAQLLALFWNNHNPTTGMRQGNDVGTQYRSGIYTATDEQFALALASKERYQALISAKSAEFITTEIKPLNQLYYAEQYHQQYLAKVTNGYCPNHGYAANGLPEYVE